MSKKTVKRREVYWIDLGKTVGTEIRKIRPCIVITNNWLNTFHSRIVIIPMTSKPVPFVPFHLEINFAGKKSTILPEQIRSVSKKRIKWEWGKLGEVSLEIMSEVSQLLHLICELEENNEN
ncbi:type II toxin-antitoxin system PemK/MazF family toxin [endosymbiont GvMRE of Glomus versiforme]|jgi:mRNA interferase MazF|uniref:type II toxin-antitoxin system PemK/MazF family toxin n=1 Tax=endosymbiont GvMRE of Glomus versiforme TaxID=2039283 RepID=UPI000ED6D505|nr:type II toxin-antitoxin system PemK/MazF family toxin [endosymbiont GvMRE of Glomus versiforme]RHZ35907.1 mRNA interferase [endosymbiont GvMRE of Glomus versiforme]